VRYSSLSIRLVLVAMAFVFVAVALGVRLVLAGRLDSTGWWEQSTGTALYAGVVYLAVLFLRPRITPYLAGGTALAFCWLVEAFQLTPVPAALSAHSPLIRLLLGAHFDWNDVAWYPVGIVPLVVLDALVGVRSRSTSGSARGRTAGRDGRRTWPRRSPSRR
jgi:Protein of unknown function (DUF2809)